MQYYLDIFKLNFMLIGITVCLFISEVNSLLLPVLKTDMSYVTTVITPITEELADMIGYKG